MTEFFWIPTQSNNSPKKQNYFVNSFLLVLRKVTVLMHEYLLHATVQMGVLRFRISIFISTTVQCHMLNTPE